MGYRYYATVTFPAAAQDMPEIAHWLATNRHFDVNHWSETVRVSHAECSNGAIEITDVLDALRVPYDHYHSDDCSGSPEPETEYVRFSEEGERIVRTVTEEHDVRANLARELLALHKAGDVDSLARRLSEVVADGPTETIDDIANAWQRPSIAVGDVSTCERERG